MHVYSARTCCRFAVVLTLSHTLSLSPFRASYCLARALCHSTASFSHPHSQIAPSPYCLLTLGGEKARTDHHADTAAPFFGESFTLPVDDDVSVLVANVHSHNMVRMSKYSTEGFIFFVCCSLLVCRNRVSLLDDSCA